MNFPRDAGRPKSRPGSLTIDTDLVATHHKFVKNLLTSHARSERALCLSLSLSLSLLLLLSLAAPIGDKVL